MSTRGQHRIVLRSPAHAVLQSTASWEPSTRPPPQGRSWAKHRQSASHRGAHVSSACFQRGPPPPLCTREPVPWATVNTDRTAKHSWVPAWRVLSPAATLSSGSGGGSLCRLSWVKKRISVSFLSFSPHPLSPVPYGQPTHWTPKNHIIRVPTAPYPASCLGPCSKQGSCWWLPGYRSSGCTAGPAVEGACGSRSSRPAALVSVLSLPPFSPRPPHSPSCLGVWEDAGKGRIYGKEIRTGRTLK